MTIDELATEAQKGDREQINKLWEETNRFIYYYLNKIEKRNPANTERMRQAGLTHEDIRQEAYFVLCDALKTFHPQEGYTFLSALRFAALRRFFSLIGMRTEKQRKEPLSCAVRFEHPIIGEDSEDLCVADTVSDENAINELETILDKEVYKELKKEVYEALGELESEQRETIEQIYFDGLTMGDISREQKVKSGIVRTRRDKALCHIRKNHGRQFIPYAVEMGIIAENAYGTTLSTFRHTRTSSTERAAIKLEEAKKRMKKC